MTEYIAYFKYEKIYINIFNNVCTRRTKSTSIDRYTAAILSPFLQASISSKFIQPLIPLLSVSLQLPLITYSENMSEDFVADPPSTEELQKEGIEYDRRQIRRKLRERLQERGEDLEDEQDIGAREDEVSVYEDTEFFPWKQREAAVEAAALGGKTEGRMEGFDSLERALQAHTHKLHYGRGRAFGWSNQKQHSGSIAERGKSLLGSKTQLTDWTSFRDLSIAHENSGETKVATVETKQAQLDEAQRNRMKDIKAMKTQKRNSNILKTIYIVSAIGVCLGFAYYIEKLKIDNYQNYLPEGYIEQATVATNTGSGNDPSRHLEPGQTRQIKSFEMATAGRDAKFIAVRDVLAFKWSDRNDLDREGTPQYNAAYWLCYHDMMNLGIPNSKAESDHLVQRFALATLYFATGGNEWSFADHFMTGLHECDWHVLDDKGKTQFGASHCESGKVTRLVLSKWRLRLHFNDVN